MVCVQAWHRWVEAALGGKLTSISIDPTLQYLGNKRSDRRLLFSDKSSHAMYDVGSVTSHLYVLSSNADFYVVRMDSRTMVLFLRIALALKAHIIYGIVVICMTLFKACWRKAPHQNILFAVVF